MEPRLSDTSDSEDENARPMFGGTKSSHLDFDNDEAPESFKNRSPDPDELPKPRFGLSKRNHQPFQRADFDSDETPDSFENRAPDPHELPRPRFELSRRSHEDSDSDESSETVNKRARHDDELARPSFGNQKHNHRDFGTGEPAELYERKFRHRDTGSAKPEPDAAEGSHKAQRMMKSMGYTEGVGLGKHGQGRLEPVELSKQRGRRGLGHHIPGLERADLEWDPSEEKVTVEEEMPWLSNSHPLPPTTQELEDWLGFGPKKTTIDDETMFCDPNILKEILRAKSIFDLLDGHELRRARTRSNPYETIRGAFFLNRAAVKMANIDRACDFMFTDTKSLDPNELLYFADVCAGPGGFSEYVLWKNKWDAKGFGFTLKNENDFKLDDFYAGPCETFHPYYGPKKDGNVYDPVNQVAFRNLIMEETKGKGLHFMMADGGFSVEGQENIQEILSKQLYLCQCLVALMVVKEGGHFVTKLFDLFTPFSAGLVYLMYRCFDRICLCKPNTSRPANSERYLVCKGKRPDIEEVIRHLSHVNGLLHKDNEQDDVVQLVAMDELEAEQDFLDYLRTSNDTLGKKQIVGLKKIHAFCQDPNLMETRQGEMREKCLAHWGLPDKTRTAPRRWKPQEKLQSLITNTTLNFLTSPHTPLTNANVDSTVLNSPYDWFCMPCMSGQDSDKRLATFYMGLGRTNVFRLEKGNWIRVEGPLELPPDTLVYAEMAVELRGDFRSQMKISALHIIDAYLLGGVDVSRMHLTTRSAKTRKFCEALWKPESQPYHRVRPKELHSVERGVEELYACLERQTMKNGNQVRAYVPSKRPNYCDGKAEERYYIVPNSVLFLKGTASPWSRHLSRSTGFTYYYNRKTRETKYDKDMPADAAANFCETFANRIVWFWPPTRESPSTEHLLDLIKAKCRPQQAQSH